MKNPLDEIVQEFRNSQTRSRIEGIETMLTIPQYRDHARKLLQTIEVADMSLENKFAVYFLKARYHHLCFTESKDVEHLELANNFMDHVFTKAALVCIPITDLDYHFAYANIKRALARHTQSDLQRNRLTSEAEIITDDILEIHPENADFLWIKQELSAIQVED